MTNTWLNELEQRFGKEGVQELAILDMRAADLLDRLYKLTSITVNMQKIDPDGAHDFYKKFLPYLNMLMLEYGKVVNDFQDRRGEI